MGMDEHGQKVFQSAQAAGDVAAGLGRRDLRASSRRPGAACTARTTTGCGRPSRAMPPACRRCWSGSGNGIPTTSSSANTKGSTASAARSSSRTAQLVDGRCPEHPSRELVRTKETNTFFRLSALPRPRPRPGRGGRRLPGRAADPPQRDPQHAARGVCRTSRSRARGCRGASPSPAPTTRPSTSGSTR